MQFDHRLHQIVGEYGQLPVAPDDEIAMKFVMLMEGQCEKPGRSETARKYGYTRQRYAQLLQAYKQLGTAGLQSKLRGPKRNYRRTDEVVRQVIRYRFLDPDASADVIAQRLRQTGFAISTRSVERVIGEYGLQKKTLHLSATQRTAGNR